VEESGPLLTLFNLFSGAAFNWLQTAITAGKVSAVAEIDNLLWWRATTEP
jgi:hypothetical protein